MRASKNDATTEAISHKTQNAHIFKTNTSLELRANQIIAINIEKSHRLNQHNGSNTFNWNPFRNPSYFVFKDQDKR